MCKIELSNYHENVLSLMTTVQDKWEQCRIAESLLRCGCPSKRSCIAARRNVQDVLKGSRSRSKDPQASLDAADV